MRLRLLLLCLITLISAKAANKEIKVIKKEKQTTTVVEKTKQNKIKKQVEKKPEEIDYNAQISRTSYDHKIDGMIQTALGEEYRRANIYDFYPMVLPPHKARGRNEEERKELLDYYDYARKDLEKLNQSKLLKTITLDFNLDRTPDTAIIVHNIKKKTNHLVIINRTESLLMEDFKQNYLEIMNHGRYPTLVLYEQGTKRKTIDSPSIRLVAFDGPSYLLYYDRKGSAWDKLFLNE